MTSVIGTLSVHIFAIGLTVAALRHIRTLAGRRSARREMMTNTGVVIIVMGLIFKAITQMPILIAGISPSEWMYLSNPLIATGYVFILTGFYGWDRVTLHIPSWWSVIMLLMIVHGGTIWGYYEYQSYWTYIPITAISFMLLVIDLLLLSYIMRQRYFIALPFLLLHIASTMITGLIEVSGSQNINLLEGMLLTSATTALLFYINMRLVMRLSTRGRMLIV
ncbi:MAG: hypothetical protein ACO3F2_09955 [Roseiflexaceae bacterium]